MPTSDFRKQLFTYLLLVLAFSSIFYFPILKSHRIGAGGGMFVLGIMWSPGLAALLTCRITRRPLASLGWKWPQARYAWLSYLLPLGYAAVTYAAVWLLGLGRFYNREFVGRTAQNFGLGPMPDGVAIVFYFLLMGTLGMVRSASSALGEEIGWRGFLVPHLAQRFTLAQTSVISGTIWALWHFPAIFFADYNSGTPRWYAATCFFVMVVGMSFLFAWIRLKSGSLWTGVLLHASHNLFIQAFFDPITANTGWTAWIIGEFGVALAIAGVILAVYFWTRRAEVERLAAPAASPAIA